MEKAGYWCKMIEDQSDDKAKVQVFYNQKFKELMNENDLHTAPVMGNYENLFDVI